MKILLFLIYFFPLTASATIWITLSDPKENKIGVVGASSGLIGNKRTILSVDNHGIAVVGSWYVEKDHRKLKRFIKSSSQDAPSTASELSQFLNLDQHKRRVSFVNSQFQNAARPGRGCHEYNAYCGSVEEEHFTIVGGGLASSEVITKTQELLKSQAFERLPFECKLYRSIEAIFLAGGEIKTMNRLAFVVDDLSKKRDAKIVLFHRKKEEKDLLIQFEERLRQKRIVCSPQVSKP